MRTTVTRIYRFEAAHSLPGFGGPAEALHGHSYAARVEVEGGYRTEDLDAAWSRLLPRLDHALLNEAFDDTTVEGLAAALFGRLADAGAPVRSVEVQEGDLRFGRALG